MIACVVFLCTLGVLLSGCAQTLQFTPSPAPAQHQLPGLPANAVDVQVHDRRTDTTVRDALPHVLKAQLVASLSPEPTPTATTRYRLIVDVIDHRAVFTPGSPYWTASTRFRARLLEPSGNILGQWDALGSGRRWNMWGYATAQAVAQESYNMAVAELLSALAPVSYARTATPKTPDSPRLSATTPAPTSMGSTSIMEEIPLVKTGGIYALPVAINGVLTLNFILDSGATEVNIPADVALTLLRTGTITDSDFLPGATYVLADGSKLKSPRLMLRSLTIGHHIITNVSASVGNTASSLLLGQSFLEKLGTWGIDTQRQVLMRYHPK